MPPVPAGRGSVIEARFADGVWHCGRLVELIKGSVVWGMRSRTGTGRRMCGWGIRTFRADRKRKREDRASAQVFDVRQDLLGLQQRRSTGGCIAGKCRTSARIVARPFRGPTAWLHPFITTQRRATATSALESVEGRNDHRFRISWRLEKCRNVEKPRLRSVLRPMSMQRRAGGWVRLSENNNLLGGVVVKLGWGLQTSLTTGNVPDLVCAA